MTTHWEKGDSHVILVIEGDTINCKELKKALEINLQGNLLIDAMSIQRIDKSTEKYLDEFSLHHKAQKFSIILASPLKKLGFKNLEVIPTISEARDLIYMEIAERELDLFDE